MQAHAIKKRFDLEDCGRPMRELGWLLHGSSNQRNLLAMLVAYVDESGGSSTPVLAMAGYVSSVESWERFATVWKKLLVEFDVPYLHMREFAHSRGAFEGWRPYIRDRFSRKFVNAIKDHILFGVGCAVSLDDYRVIVESDSRMRIAIGDPYFLCFNGCIAKLLDHFRRLNCTEDIAFVLDENKAFSNLAVQVYKAIRTTNYPGISQLGDIAFADDKKRVQLQAADVIAYETHKYLVEKLHNSGRPMRGSLGSLLHRAHHIIYYDRPRLIELVESARTRLLSSQ